MFIFAINLNDDTAAHILAEVVKVEDSAHGSELYTLDVFGTGIPMVIDTLHYGVQELTVEEYDEAVVRYTEDAIWEASEAAKRERQIILDKRDGIIA